MRRNRHQRSLHAARWVAVGLGLLLGATLHPIAADEGDAGKPAGSGRPLLWVSKGEPRLYLFGTLDVPDARAQALPRSVEQALDACDVFYTDLPRADVDLARLEVQAKRVSALPVDAGGLKKLLGDDLYTRAALFIPPPGVSVLESREPWYVQRLIERAYLEGAYPHGVVPLAEDLWDRARIEGSQTAGLDTAPEYVEIFDALTLDEQVAWLQATVERHEKDKKTEAKEHERLVAAYVAGDPDKVRAIWRERLPAGKLGEKLARGFLTDRVRRMLGRLASRLKREPDVTVFLALDASLLAGEGGALKLLAAQGHDLRRTE